MSRSSDPQLPKGSPKALHGFTESFAFHASPEAFIASCISDFQSQPSRVATDRPVVHAKILNRNVAVVSSFAQIAHLLALPDNGNEQRRNGQDPVLVASAAYEQFLAGFFPGPNLLLSDGDAHATMREIWAAHMHGQHSRMRPLVKETAAQHFRVLSGTQIDLYASLKSLVWKIILQAFLKLDGSDAEFVEIQALQEDLLRGQFSLFPVSINLMMWQSPRSRGISARKKLQELISKRLETLQGGCPLDMAVNSGSEEGKNQAVNHALMFTSSLAVKGIASLLTAFLLNVFLYKRDGMPLLDDILALQEDKKAVMLQGVMRETERLSPPIVGIMRRVTRDVVIPSVSSDAHEPDVLIPAGWDAWLYFVGGGRDPQAFGDSWGSFVPGRFLDTPDMDSGLAFSASSKSCLGKDLVREICVSVANAMLEAGLSLKGEIAANGVRAWLGWREAKPEDWARDMKQLPTQRPTKPILVMLDVKP